jgi:membrane protein DedA with SNARE-associated domain
MFDWLVDTFTRYPYLGVAIVFFMCGVGLPLPEEIVLVAAGYVCFKGFAQLLWMMATCGGSILLGDALPFVLGRVFGPRLLRLRPLRIVVNRRRLAMLDRWFRRRGDLAVFFARFVPGLRVVAYFTAGTLRMRAVRFLTLDIAGIALVCPPLIFVGYHFGDVIDEAILLVQRVERGILWTVIAAVVVLALGWSIRQRRKQREQTRAPAETYVAPTVPPLDTESMADAASAGTDAHTEGPLQDKQPGLAQPSDTRSD